MKNKFLTSVAVNLIIIACIVAGFYQVWKKESKPQLVNDVQVNYHQPVLIKENKIWAVRSVDTQVISKHWEKVDRFSIRQQVQLLKELGVNYIAIGTPYDRVGEMRMWTEEIHNAGLNVWFRSHWAEWEGDDGKPASMAPDAYLKSTANFIRNNPDLFKPGDSFTMAVEPEQVGVGLGKKFLNWSDYRNFLLLQVSMSNEAFKDIGLKDKVHTNWLSVNGWVVENQFTEDLVRKLGLITVDHFVSQNQTIGNLEDRQAVVRDTISDLDDFHNRWGVPILLGEWGYQIFQTVPEEQQKEVVDKMYEELSKRNYLVGVNYWTHMGNTASIISDQYGANLQYRKAAEIVKKYYTLPALPNP